MAQFLYWLDRGSFVTMLQHAGIWAMVVGIAGIANIVGIAAILRHYDGARNR